MTVAPLPAIAVVLALGLPSAADDDVPLVALKVTQKSLQPLCLDGVPVKAGERRWRLGLQEHSLAFTMRNQPRPGAPGSEMMPGIAVIAFTPEAGHAYEVEIRAPAATYGRRAWERGEWKPVVRDRTADRIVSSEPEWRDSPCPP
jgi:hypothetical protein